MCAISELLIAGCRGQAARMLGPTGSFGIDEDTYEDYMYCAWRIEVEAAKVSNVYYYYYY